MSFCLIKLFEKKSSQDYLIGNLNERLKESHKAFNLLKGITDFKYKILDNDENIRKCNYTVSKHNSKINSGRIFFSKTDFCSFDFVPLINYSQDFHVVFPGVTYVFSAYLDTRPTSYFIRIIGISDFWQDSRPRWCRIWYRELNSSYIEHVIDEVVTESHGKRLIVNLYSCKVRKNATPYAVSLTRHACDKPLSVLPVIDSKIENKQNICVCTSPMFDNYNNIHQLIEFIKVNEMFGVSFFSFYNMSIGKEMNKYLTRLSSYSNIEVTQWKMTNLFNDHFGNDKDFKKTQKWATAADIHYHGQLAALLDCFYRNFKKFHYILFLDLDEILVPRRWNNLPQTLNNIPRIENSCALIFQNVFFHNMDYNNSDRNDQKSFMDDIKCLSHVNREKIIWQHGKRSKYIANTRYLEIPGVHTPLKCIKNEKAIDINTTMAFLHHYRWWTNKISLKSTFVDDYLFKFKQKIIDLISSAHKALL